MEILDLVLMRKYYDQIECGEKPEEYRDTCIWCARLLDVDRDGYGHFQHACRGDFEDLLMSCHDSLSYFTTLLKDAIEKGIYQFRKYDAGRFHRGYTNTTMIFAFKESSIGYWNTAWGAPEDYEVFIIKLGERLE